MLKPYTSSQSCGQLIFIPSYSFALCAYAWFAISSIRNSIMRSVVCRVWLCVSFISVSCHSMRVWWRCERARTLNFDELIDLVPKNDDKYAKRRHTVDDRTFIHISAHLINIYYFNCYNQHLLRIRFFFFSSSSFSQLSHLADCSGFWCSASELWQCVLFVHRRRRRRCCFFFFSLSLSCLALSWWHKSRFAATTIRELSRSHRFAGRAYIRRMYEARTRLSIVR